MKEQIIVASCSPLPTVSQAALIVTFVYELLCGISFSNTLLLHLLVVLVFHCSLRPGDARVLRISDYLAAPAHTRCSIWCVG